MRKKIILILTLVIAIVFVKLYVTYRTANEKINYEVKSLGRIKKIKVVNKTTNKRLKETVIISNPDDLKEFEVQIERLKKVIDPNVKSSYGYYEVYISYENNYELRLDVVETVYDGIVISNINTDESFKNNTMLDLMIYSLKKD